MEVIDATVFAYALLKEPGMHEEAAQVFERAKEIAVPDIFRAEFANVIWKWERARRLPPDQVLPLLGDCQGLITKVVDGGVLWESALLLAMEQSHPVYDCFYVALGRKFDTKVITYDKRFRMAFPHDTQAPAAFLRRP